MSDELFKVIIALIPVIGAIITGFLIPWIKTKINAETLSTCIEWADKAVWCAQQIYTPEQWEEKKKFVLDFLEDEFGTTLSEAQIKILHEAAVKELKLAEKAVEEK